MPILNTYACKKRVEYSCRYIPKDARILEIGSGGGWFGDYMKNNGWRFYTGLDIEPPADIVGSILDWKEIGIQEKSFDVVVAFEVVEHVSCFREVYEILKPGGLFILTSPLPCFDWACNILEMMGLSQKRTSPHGNLINFKDIPYLHPIKTRRIGFIVQWGVLEKLPEER